MTADAATLKIIFDRRLNLEPDAALTTFERKAINDTVYWQAQRAWQQDQNCDFEPFQILDAATGSFTRPRATQKAVLYRLCRYARQLGYGGLAILKNGRLVRHDVWNGGSEFALGKMPDLNRDGIEEVLVSFAGLNMGEMWMVMTIAQLGSKTAKLVKQFDAYHDNCGSVSPPLIQKAWKVYAEADDPLRFYQQCFAPIATRASLGCKLTDSNPFHPPFANRSGGNGCSKVNRRIAE